MKKLLIILHWSFLSQYGYTQNYCIDCHPDSIKQIKLNAHTSRDTLYAIVAELDNTGGPETHKKIIATVSELLELNARLKLIDERPYELYREGVVLWDLNERKKAIDKLKEAVEAFDRQKKIMGCLSLLSVIREYFNYANLQEERYTYYQEKLRYYQKNGPVENTGACYHAIAGYDAYKADYNHAISYYLKAADVYKSFSIYGYFYEFSAIGKYYYIWGNYERAQYYTQAGYDWFLKAGCWEIALICKMQLALIDKKNKDYPSALRKIDESLKIFDLHSASTLKTMSLAEKGGILLEMNRPEEAYQAINEAMVLRDSLSLPMVSIQGDFEGEYYLFKYYRTKGDESKAEKQLLLAYAKALESKSDGLILKYRKELAVFYSETGKPNKAISLALSYITFSDSLREAQNNNNIAEYEKKQQENKNEQLVQGLQAQKKVERNYFIIAGIFLLLLSIGIFSRLQFMRKMKRQLEDKNKQIESEKLRAEQSEKFKQQFLANMSHEIRTPMNAVMGMTSLLIDKDPRNDQLHYLDGIKKSSETLLYIIKDILDLSKIEAGKIELEHIDFSLRDIIGQVELMLLHKADEKGIQLITEIDESISIVIGDPIRLYQVLMNLAGNAIKFTEEGFVRIVVKAFRNENATLQIQFSIIDTGIGIPKDKLESVFETFSQAHISDTRKYGGTGLGLSISKHLVQLLGGEIVVESEEGTGTIFSFQLHFEEGSVERLQQRIRKEDSIDGTILNGLKILIVDDNDYNLIVASDTLRLKADVTIATATNGKEAILSLQENDFDVVLMDVQMPEMNGLDACRYIRDHFAIPKNNVPIIALTASVLRTDIDKCKQAGMNAYIPKPFKASQLIKGIAEVLGLEIRTISNTEIPQPYPAPSIVNHSKIADLTYLRNFCEGDTVRMKKYIAMYVDSAPLLIEKLTLAMNGNDYDEIADQIHAYKTKWVMMGMKEAKILAYDLEQQCRQPSVDDSVQQNLTRLIVLIQGAIVELSQT